jgi:4-hydroxyphenylpyruvate dioxygenase
MSTNPVGIKGVEFVEFTSPDGLSLENLLIKFGFRKLSAQPSAFTSLYRQNNINVILNIKNLTFAETFSQKHGPSICAMGWRVEDSQKAFDIAIKNGAKAYEGTDQQKGATPFRAVFGIGDSLIYFLDDKDAKTLYDDIFMVRQADLCPPGKGFTRIDHFTNNVPKGDLDKWCDFYSKIFGFQDIRHFDIKGKKTGLYSKVMKSPCGTFCIPINEPTDGKSQIQEYLDQYKGAGVQHLAFLTDDIVKSLDALKNSNISLLTPPPHTYYEDLKTRLPNVAEDIEILEKHSILVDGDEQGYLLQVFTTNLIGPIFVEIIQRKNHGGFGEGNFQALFDAIERDQENRGFLK